MSNFDEKEEFELIYDQPPVQVRTASKYTPQGDGNQSDLIERILVSNYSPHSRSSSKSNRSSSKSNRSSKKSSSKSEKSKSSSKKSSSSSSEGSSNDLFEECETFIEVLTEVFEQPDNIDASIYCANPEDIQDNCDDYFVYINIWNKNTDKICAYVQYSSTEKTIHIEEITRCTGEILPEQGSGTDIIQKLIEVGEVFSRRLEPGTDLSIVVDSDQSKLTVKDVTFELNWLYIFATGQSWYNSLGFKEEEYDNNTEMVEKFINKKNGKTTIREQFQKIKRDLKDPDISVKTVEKYKQKLDSIREKFYTFLTAEIKKGNTKSGQFRTKFRQIKYDNPTGVGFGLKKKSKSRKNKGQIKKRRLTKKR
jgi:hypothetical protein